MQIAAGPGINRRSRKVVGCCIGDFDFDIEVRFVDLDQGHVLLLLVLGPEIDDKANMTGSNHMTGSFPP